MAYDPNETLKDEFGYGGEEPFTIQLPLDVAWLITQKVCPGPSFAGSPVWRKIVDLRQKIHEALITMAAMPPPQPGEKPPSVPLTITTDEAWVLDQVVPFDGLGGGGEKFLMSLYRGLYARAKGIPIELTEAVRKSDSPLPEFDFDLKKPEPEDLGKRDIVPTEPASDDNLLATS